MLKRFSERKGLTKTRTIAQVDSIDDQLRNGLWDMLTVVYWKQAGDSFGLNRLLSLADAFWHSYFKEPLDTRPAHWGDIWSRLRDYFFGCLWYCVYDFIEFTANTHSDEQSNKRFTEACNRILEREQSAYRFVGKQIVQITSKDEIATIEEALGTPFKTVQIHFKSASRMMSDRKSPDYRNSIKESISAVEAICRIIAQNEKATLGQALNVIEKKEKIALHGALKRAFESLYGYTSSSEGIRHSLLEETKLSFEDAKFMLVSCSAFVNYLVSKATKAGLNIE